MGKRAGRTISSEASELKDTEPSGPLENLESRLQYLIDLIPPQNYGLDEEIMSTVRDHKHKLVNNKLRRVEQKKFSNACKQRMSRFDHNQLHTVSQIWEFLKSTPMSKNKVEKSLPKKKDKAKGVVPSPSSVLNGPSRNRQEAMKKLQEKILDMKQQRKGTKTAEDHELSRKLKRKVSKIKRKEKVKLEKDAPGNKMKVFEKKEIETSDKPEEKIKVNSEKNVVFSKFDFAVGTKSRWEQKKEKKLNEKREKGTLAHKDIQKNMKVLEKRQKRLENLAAEGEDAKVEEIKNEQKWSAALHKAQGIKVKDDASLLQKSMKKQEDKKKRSTKKWEGRTKIMKDKQEEKQNKRQNNLLKRKHDKKKTKLEKARKRGRLV